MQWMYGYFMYNCFQLSGNYNYEISNDKQIPQKSRHVLSKSGCLCRILIKHDHLKTASLRIYQMEPLCPEHSGLTWILETKEDGLFKMVDLVEMVDETSFMKKKNPFITVIGLASTFGLVLNNEEIKTNVKLEFLNNLSAEEYYRALKVNERIELKGYHSPTGYQGITPFMVFQSKKL